jgi:hypothetical protein
VRDRRRHHPHRHPLPRPRESVAGVDSRRFVARGRDAEPGLALHVAQVAADLDISQQCIYAWRRQQMIDLGQIPGTTTAPRTIALLMCRAGIRGLPNHPRPAHVTTPRPPST